MTSLRASPGRILRIVSRAYRIPTDRPEADGTLEWDSTPVVVVEATSDQGEHGYGFSYAATAASGVVEELLEAEIVGRPVDQPRAGWQAMVAKVRNAGLPGVAASAISAVDVALWDLHARSLRLPLYRVLGAAREGVPIYGSGGFTSYTVDELQAQLSRWVAEGVTRVKMKVGLQRGSCADEDVHRVAAAREAIGESTELFVDANGAYTAKQAVELGRRFSEHGVSYFEEPVSSDHLEQMGYVRQNVAPAVAAGEYGYSPWYFRRMLEARAVDILQADVTRCLGITGFLAAGALADAFGVPFSAHTAPTIHAHVGCAVPRLEHVEYFHDHARLEPMLFEGVPMPLAGVLRPDPNRAGLGLELREHESEQWRVA